MVDRGLFDKQYHTAASLVGIPAVHLPSQSSNYSQRQILGPSFQPSNWDVICHNSKEYQEHIGNKRFKICIENHLSSYMKAPSRIAKSVVITNLVNSIRDSATEQGGGGFVRFDSSCGLWYEVGEKIARDKVGQALRDAARLQSEKRKSITIDSSSSSSSSSHPHRDDGRFPLAEPSITPSTTPDNTVAMVKQERSGQSVLKWTHNEDSERLSPSSAPTIAKNDSGADSNSSSFWFRQNTTAMPRTRGTTQHSSTTDEEVMAAFAESLEGDISSHNQRHQQQARTGSPSIMLFSSERVLSPLPSSSIPSSSSLEGIEAADALLEWFENDI